MKKLKLLRIITMSNLKDKFLSKFFKLEQDGISIKNTFYTSTGMVSIKCLDNELLQKWQTKAKNLLILCCGENSIQYREFVNVENKKSLDYPSIFERQNSILIATKEDLEDDFLTSIKSLIQAEIFDNELEQSKELLKSNYYVASAVIAGVVLENGLRELCNRENLEIGKLDKMNSDLAKKGIYNKLQQKRITSLADIRNSAAHGKNNEFTKSDVERMIEEIEQFLSIHLI